MTLDFLAMALLIVLGIYLLLWARTSGTARGLAVLLGLAAATLAFVGNTNTLGLPKPVALEWWRRAAPEATVLGSVLRTGEGIYLWLQLDNEPRPLYYSLPWNESTAKELAAASRGAENGGRLRMRNPFEPSWDREPQFYAEPQPALPPKREPPKPKVVERDA